jgi:hypothetical protein
MGYHFRYSGLRFVARSEARYVLLPENWSRQRGSAIILEDRPELRFEFEPPRFPW